MSIVRVGSNQRYAEGWEAVFGRKKTGTRKATVAAAKKSGKKAASRRK